MPLPLIKEPYGLNKGLLLATGDHWRMARRSLSPTFSASKMRMVEFNCYIHEFTAVNCVASDDAPY